MKLSELPAYPQHTKPFARTLRKNMTPAELKLWGYIRRRQLRHRFRRQLPVGNYIIDFASLQTELAIEIDGGQHYGKEQRKKDQQRTRYLESLGFTVIRFNNHEVLSNIEGVVECIGEVLEKLEKGHER